jgi:hypothetical protein
LLNQPPSFPPAALLAGPPTLLGGFALPPAALKLDARRRYSGFTGSFKHGVHESVLLPYCTHFRRPRIVQSEVRVDCHGAEVDGTMRSASLTSGDPATLCRRRIPTATIHRMPKAATACFACCRDGPGLPRSGLASSPLMRILHPQAGGVLQFPLAGIHPALGNFRLAASHAGSRQAQPGRAALIDTATLIAAVDDTTGRIVIAENHHSEGASPRRSPTRCGQPFVELLARRPRRPGRLQGRKYRPQLVRPPAGNEEPCDSPSRKDSRPGGCGGRGSSGGRLLIG